MHLKLLKIIRIFHLIDKETYNKKRQIESIKQSGLFDEEWYAEMYPDIFKECASPIEHYVLYGWKEGKNPSEDFDGTTYLEMLPELKVKNWSPLFHYVLENKVKISKICFFKKLLYNLKNILINSINRVIYFGKSTDYILVKKSKLFNEKWYLTQYPKVAEKRQNPIEYYLSKGWKEGQNTSVEFNTRNYQLLNIDNQKVDICPLIHYLQHKAKLNDKPDLFAPKTIEMIKHFTINTTKGRTAIFASFSADGKIPQTTIYYLKELRKVVSNIIYISDSPIYATEIKKIKDLVCYCSFLRHGEYDFGSYKRGFILAKNIGLLDNTTELVFCNDSCYGAVYPFSEMFEKMQKENTDFWGITANKTIKLHLQSYFLVFRPQVFKSKAFTNFITSIRQEKSYWSVVLRYETRLTNTLLTAGFSFQTYIPYNMDSCDYPYFFKENVQNFPIYLLAQKSPLIKAKSLNSNLYYNCEGINNTIKQIKKLQPKLGMLLEKYKISIPDISFSVIMPTYNRKNIIDKAIQSALNQSYQNFELIIVDDGSSDGTTEYLQQKYAQEIKNQKIRYYYKDKAGVCNARNFGIRQARNKWIAYLDSDNILYPHFLETFARLIKQQPQQKTFYAQGITQNSRKIIGKPYNNQRLLEGNYIDLGIFIHHISVYQELGGFDENMTRLVDWELIIRYTNKYTPFYLEEILLMYNDDSDRERISNTENWVENYLYICHKQHHKSIKSVSVIVPIYNALADVKILLTSLQKNFNFSLGDITLIDDCSDLETRQYLQDWSKKNPCFTLIQNKQNLGFVQTCNKGIKQALGDIICLLNSDTEIPTNFCEKILRCFISNKEVGIASPISSASLEYCIPMLEGKNVEDMNKLILHYRGASYPRIPSAEGFCFCIRKEVIKQQGLLDTKYGKGYHEEIDFSYRAIEHGWKIVLIHDLYVYHKRQASFGNEQREYLMAKNSPIFMKKWHGFKERYIHKNHLTNPIDKMKEDIEEYIAKSNIEKPLTIDVDNKLFSDKNEQPCRTNQNSNDIIIKKRIK